MMKKKLSIIPYITFISIILIFFYLLIIQRNPSEIPSVFINKEIPKFESSSILNPRNKRVYYGVSLNESSSPKPAH